MTTPVQPAGNWLTTAPVAGNGEALVFAGGVGVAVAASAS